MKEGRNIIVGEDQHGNELKDALDRVAELEIILNDIMDCLGIDPDTDYEDIVDEIAYRVRRYN